MITDFEKLVIDRAVENALCFGLGILTSARERIEGGVLPDELTRFGVDPAALSPARLR